MRILFTCAIQAAEYVLSSTTDTYHSCVYNTHGTATLCHYIYIHHTIPHYTTPHPTTLHHTSHHTTPLYRYMDTSELQLVHETCSYLHTSTLHTGKQRLAQLVKSLYHKRQHSLAYTITRHTNPTTAQHNTAHSSQAHLHIDPSLVNEEQLSGSMEQLNTYSAKEEHIV